MLHIALHKGLPDYRTRTPSLFPGKQHRQICPQLKGAARIWVHIGTYRSRLSICPSYWILKASPTRFTPCKVLLASSNLEMCAQSPLESQLFKPLFSSFSLSNQDQHMTQGLVQIENPTGTQHCIARTPWQSCGCCSSAKDQTNPIPTPVGPPLSPASPTLLHKFAWCKTFPLHSLGASVLGFTEPCLQNVLMHLTTAYSCIQLRDVTSTSPRAMQYCNEIQCFCPITCHNSVPFSSSGWNNLGFDYWHFCTTPFRNTPLNDQFQFDAGYVCV